MKSQVNTIRAKLLIYLSAASLCLFLTVFGFISYFNGENERSEIIIGIIGVCGLIVIFVLMLYIFIIPVIKIEKWIDRLSVTPTSSASLVSNTDIARMFNFLVTHLKEGSEREYAATLLQKQAEFSELQSQINPHFLYNTLDSIRSEALNANDYNTAEMIESLASFFRYSIGRSKFLVTLEDEIENTHIYFKIQQFRFENRFSLNIINDNPRDKALMHRLPRLTLQPIIENAIRHGLERRVGPGSITIRISLTDAMLIISVQDDGVGMKEIELDQVREKLFSPPREANFNNNSDITGEGIALANVHQRIKLMFGDVYGLSVMSTFGVGTTVEILLPRIINQDIAFDPDKVFGP